MKNIKNFIFKRHSVILSVLAIILTFALTFTGIAVAKQVMAATKKETRPMYGDVDLDGRITSEDARLALRAAVELDHYDPGSEQFKRADYDCDGRIDSEDARSILRVAVELDPVKYIDEEPDSTSHDNHWDDPYYYIGGGIEPDRAGIYYYGGHRIDYKDIPEGAEYFYYDSNGFLQGDYKPYSPGNEPSTKPLDLSHCEYCGKSVDCPNGMHGYDGQHYACYYGSCTRWIIDVNCPECGKFVPAYTCHTCGK